MASFANAAGGHIVFGVDEQASIPMDIPGLTEIDTEKEILRLESMIRDGISPRIPGIVTQIVSVEENKVVLVLRVPRSWASPHMITFKSASRFYSRSSVGNYPLEVKEIRSAFLLSESWGTRIRDFRVERLSTIVSRRTPLKIPDSPTMVLHAVPLSAFAEERTTILDLGSLTEVELNKLRLIRRLHYVVAQLRRSRRSL